MILNTQVYTRYNINYNFIPPQFSMHTTIENIVGALTWYASQRCYIVIAENKVLLSKTTLRWKAIMILLMYF